MSSPSSSSPNMVTPTDDGETSTSTPLQEKSSMHSITIRAGMHGSSTFPGLAPLKNQTRLMDGRMTWEEAFRTHFKVSPDPRRYLILRRSHIGPASKHDLREKINVLIGEFTKKSRTFVVYLLEKKRLSNLGGKVKSGPKQRSKVTVNVKATSAKFKRRLKFSPVASIPITFLNTERNDAARPKLPKLLSAEVVSEIITKSLATNNSAPQFVRRGKERLEGDTGETGQERRPRKAVLQPRNYYEEEEDGQENGDDNNLSNNYSSHSRQMPEPQLLTPTPFTKVSENRVTKAKKVNYAMKYENDEEEDDEDALSDITNASQDSQMDDLINSGVSYQDLKLEFCKKARKNISNTQFLKAQRELETLKRIYGARWSKWTSYTPTTANIIRDLFNV